MGFIIRSSLRYGALDWYIGSITRSRLDREVILIGEEIGELLDRKCRSVEWEIRVWEVLVCGEGV